MSTISDLRPSTAALNPGVKSDAVISVSRSGGAAERVQIARTEEQEVEHERVGKSREPLERRARSHIIGEAYKETHL